MQLFAAENVNVMATVGQILSHSETFIRRPGGKSRENTGIAAKSLKNRQLYHARTAPKWE